MKSKITDILDRAPSWAYAIILTAAFFYLLVQFYNHL